MIRLLLRLIGWRCAHEHVTWPHASAADGMTVSCLDCGQRLKYDWGRMRVIK